MSARSSLRRVLRDRSGRLYELNILVAFFILGTLIAIGQKSILKGFGFAMLWMFGLIAAAMLLLLLSEAACRIREIEGVKRFLANRFGRLMKPAFLGLLAAVAGAVVAGFASIFLAPLLSGTPDGQLTAMRALTAAGGTLAGVFVFVSTR